MNQWFDALITHFFELDYYGFKLARLCIWQIYNESTWIEFIIWREWFNGFLPTHMYIYDMQSFPPMNGLLILQEPMIIENDLSSNWF